MPSRITKNKNGRNVDYDPYTVASHLQSLIPVDLKALVDYPSVVRFV